MRILAEAKPNVADLTDGSDIYTRYVNGMRIGLEQVGAHYAISSVFRSYPEDGELFCFDVHRDAHETFTSGRGKVALGRARLRSRITEEAEEICYAVLHLGDQNLSAAVRRYTLEDEAGFEAFSAEVRVAIRKANLPEVIRLIDRFFAPAPGSAQDRRAPHVHLDPIDPQPGQPETAPGAVEPGIAHTVAPVLKASPRIPIAYSLTSLFADEQHRILRDILNQTVGEMEDSLRKIYEDHASLLHFLTESGMNPPPALALAASFAINASLRRAIEAEPFDADAVGDLLLRATADHVTLDAPVLAFAAGNRMMRAMAKLEALAESKNAEATGQSLHEALAVANIVRFMPFEVILWRAQNIWNDLLRRMETQDDEDWKVSFKELGLAMNIAVDELVIEEGAAIF